MAFPAVPRNAKGYDIENAINRILRWLNGLTTRGDLLVRNDKGDLTRLAVGTDGQVLTSDGTDPKWADPAYPTFTYFTNSLTSDVALGAINTYALGPSVTQGTSGTWLAVGAVTIQDTAGVAGVYAKLWDGTTIIDSRFVTVAAANAAVSIPLMGVIASPAGNIRISAADASSASGKMLWSPDGNGKGCSLTVVRIG